MGLLISKLLYQYSVIYFKLSPRTFQIFIILYTFKKIIISQGRGAKKENFSVFLNTIKRGIHVNIGGHELEQVKAGQKKDIFEENLDYPPISFSTSDIQAYQ